MFNHLCLKFIVRNRKTPLLTNFLSFICFLLIFSYPVIAEIYLDNNQTDPPGQLINIGDYRLHINCIGKGGPVVILDSGIGGFSLDWVSVQRALSNKVKICAYDRAGYGWSDPGTAPRATDHIVDELHHLLENAGLPPPFILVGHSFGGYNVQYFAKVYPGETAGIVLVDSSHPEQTTRLPDIPTNREHSKSGELVTLYRGQSMIKYYPEDVRMQLMQILSLRKMSLTQRYEYLNFTLSGEQVLHSGSLPDVPLVVVTRGQRGWPEDPYGKSLEIEWKNMQKELAHLTTKGRQVIAANSGHQIHLEQPNVVASAILSVLEQARNSDSNIHSCESESTMYC